MTLLPPNPRIGYIGHARPERTERAERVRVRFSALGASVTELPMGATRSEAETFFHDLDCVYVGGGHTANMLGLWRSRGFDQLLIDAAHRGVLLSGVSAGAVCWFEYALWDGAGTGFKPLPALGIFSGSCCPHYTSEPDRAVSFADHVREGKIPAGYAIGDGAGLFLHDGHPPAAIAARADTGVWHMQMDGETLQSRRIPAAARLV